MLMMTPRYVDSYCNNPDQLNLSAQEMLKPAVEVFSHPSIFPTLSCFKPSHVLYPSILQTLPCFKPSHVSYPSNLPYFKPSHISYPSMFISAFSIKSSFPPLSSFLIARSSWKYITLGWSTNQPTERTDWKARAYSYHLIIMRINQG